MANKNENSVNRNPDNIIDISSNFMRILYSHNKLCIYHYKKDQNINTVFFRIWKDINENISLHLII